MEMNGSRQIAAPRELVWAALNDPEVLKSAIPGCEELTGSPERRLRGDGEAEGRPGQRHLPRPRPALRHRAARRATPSPAKARAAPPASPRAPPRWRSPTASGGTLLSYDVTASVGGKLAQLGSRLIDGFAKKMADSFFDDFRAAVEPADPAAEPTETAAAAPAGKRRAGSGG